MKVLKEVVCKKCKTKYETPKGAESKFKFWFCVECKYNNGLK